MSSNESSNHVRHHENSPGDFYSVNGVCITCGAPEGEAPELIAHSSDPAELSHCYFKRQPITDDEIIKATNAIAVSCISGLRYGGKDERILKRLYEMGEESQCDYKPKGDYKLLVWNKVTFYYANELPALYQELINKIQDLYSHFDATIIEELTPNETEFKFIYRWTEGPHGVIFNCQNLSNGKIQLSFGLESETSLVAVRGTAINLNLILRMNTAVSQIDWYDMDGIHYNEQEIK